MKTEKNGSDTVLATLFAECTHCHFGTGKCGCSRTVQVYPKEYGQQLGIVQDPPPLEILYVGLFFCILKEKEAPSIKNLQGQVLLLVPEIDPSKNGSSKSLVLKSGSGEGTLWDSSLPISLTVLDAPVLCTPPLPLSQLYLWFHFLLQDPPDPGRVLEGFQKGSMKGSLKGPLKRFWRVLEGFYKGSAEDPF